MTALYRHRQPDSRHPRRPAVAVHDLGTGAALQRRFPTHYILGTTSLRAVLATASNVRLTSRRTDNNGTWIYNGETQFLNDCLATQCTSERFAQYFEAAPVGTHNLDPTPNYLPAVPVPALLRRLMPQNLWADARFIVLLREPASRMLSWYNHRRRFSLYRHRRSYRGGLLLMTANFMQCSWKRGALSGVNHWAVARMTSTTFWPSFDEDALCNLAMRCTDRRGTRANLVNQSRRTASPYADPLLAGHYVSHLNRWRAAGWRREQMLVLNFEYLVRNSSRALPAIRAFANIGSTIDELPRVERPELHDPTLKAQLPPIRDREAAQARMCCSTARLLLDHFQGPNAALYAALRDEQQAGLTPREEPPFPPFMAPPCMPCQNSSSAAIATRRVAPYARTCRF